MKTACHSGGPRRLRFAAPAPYALMVAVLFLGLFWLGVHHWGLAGGLAGQALGAILAYPATVWLARRHGAWDPLHDVLAVAAGLAIAAAFVRPSQVVGLF